MLTSYNCQVAAYFTYFLQFLIHQLRTEVWRLSITIVSQKMLTVLTSSLVQERNASPLLLNVFGKTLKMFVLGLKHAANWKINLLWALKTTSTILKKATDRPMDFRHRKVYYESIRSVRYCLIFTVMLSYIVHKGNILTDSRNERRHFERKQNQL